MWKQVKKPNKLLTLLQAIAFQLGSQVSFHELGQMCALDSKTVEKYVNLLEQTYVIFRLGSFSRNPKTFLENYSNSEFSVITPDNMDAFLSA